jgi:hypothetical protein
MKKAICNTGDFEIFFLVVFKFFHPTPVRGMSPILFLAIQYHFDRLSVFK